MRVQGGSGGLLAGAIAVSWTVAAPAAAEPPFVRTEERADCAGYEPLRRPHFGDLHVHTAFSQDASTQGTRNTPRDAYRFARGERIGIQPYADGEPLRSLQLQRPLDFSAVTDHAEMLGETHICSTPGAEGHGSLICRLYRRFPRIAFFLMNSRSSAVAPVRYGFCGPEGRLCLEAALTPWREIQAAAEEAYDRSPACRFTSFVGYEWTGSTDTNNLHRNVIFRNERVPALPTSFIEEDTAEGLWRALQERCRDRGDGCDAIVIPHNSNLSNGFMFPTTRPDGSSIDAEDAARRADYERLVEVMQHKGDSECAFGSDSEDELCAFEKLPFQNFMASYVPWLARPPAPSSFVRRTLGQGLLEADRLGENPFAFGLIASTDTHLGTPGAVSEEDYPGHGGAGAPSTSESPTGLTDKLAYNPGGLAVLWAEENSRDALFAAMQRREVYGTSGPRLRVRFFGGWDYPARLCDDARFAATGYERGVPMGGELPPRPADATAPVFALSALRDPGTPRRPGTPLQRIQIVKGWVEGGSVRERVHEVAGDPKSGADVERDTCMPRGEGFDELCSVWRDPDFDPARRAFYYARVLENPTCRWSERICRAHAVDCDGAVPPELAPCCDPDHRRTIQERAWTSPIWYAPEAGR